MLKVLDGPVTVIVVPEHDAANVQVDVEPDAIISEDQELQSFGVTVTSLVVFILSVPRFLTIILVPEALSIHTPLLIWLIVDCICYSVCSPAVPTNTEKNV